MKLESPPSRLDVKAFAQSASSLAGSDVLRNHERLLQEANGQGSERVLKWTAHGELRTDEAGAQQVWLHLTVDVSLPLVCQRCLGLVDVAVAVARSFRFVEGEEAAEAQDDEAEEDVLAISQDFSLVALIEDEVLMALPVVPRHEHCPVDVKLEGVDPEFDAATAEKRNPFAVLAKLQGGSSS